MRRVFVDTAYLQATFLRGDDLHDVALQRGEELEREQARYVTTSLVFVELLATLSRFGPGVRGQAVRFVNDFRSRGNVLVVDFDAGLLDRALALYEARRDKRYSLADCAAMVVCHDNDINEVLTSDRDFSQEGFLILLEDDA